MDFERRGGNYLRMITTESYFKSGDHHRLYYQFVSMEKSRGVLVVCHGLNEHSGRYQNLIHHFSKAGYSIYLYDHRGHGKSDGVRSHIDHFKTILDDLHTFSSLVFEKEGKKRIFLVGHSLGGQIILNYLANTKHHYAGFIASSPNIRMAIEIPLIKKFVGLKLSAFLPRLKLGNEIDPKWISRDKKVVEDYKRDSLVSKSISVRLASEIIKNQDQIMACAKKISLPGLILHGGDDHICSSKGTRDFFSQLASMDKELKIYDGFYHELFNERGKEKVFHDMEEWIQRHS